MDWYVPLTVLPAVALIILSTSNFIVSLNNEINQLEKSKNATEWVIDQKITELTRLGMANVLLYTSSIFFMVSALTKVIYNKALLYTCLMIIAVLLFTIALLFLLMHSIRAIKIRKQHLKNK